MNTYFFLLGLLSVCVVNTSAKHVKDDQLLKVLRELNAELRTEAELTGEVDIHQPRGWWSDFWSFCWLTGCDGDEEEEEGDVDDEDADVQCGRAAVGSRIIGGAQVDPRNSLPWQVFFYADGSMCGGSIISKNYILTAAHCVDGLSTEDDLRIYVGGDAFLWSGVRYGVAQIIVHENYDSSNYDSDIALLKLDSSLEWSDFVIPICVPESTAVVGTNCIVSGWGKLVSGQTSSLLMEVTVPILASNNCGLLSDPFNAITDNMLCAGFPDAGGKDSCQGDSGGPLSCPRGGASELHGVVSWGYGCADVGYPGVYTRVSRYITWIQNNMNEPYYTS